MKEDKNKYEINFQNINQYLLISGIFVIIIWFLNPILGLVTSLAYTYMIYYSFRLAREEKKNFISYVEGLSDEFDSATKNAIFNMPFPLVILGDQGQITWYNTPFLNMLGGGEVLGEKISSLVPDLTEDEIYQEDISYTDVFYKDRYYKVYPNFVDMNKTSSKNQHIVSLYWVDNTNFVKLNRLYTDEKSVVALVYVDNYDDVKKSTNEVNRPLVMAEIDKEISSYFSKYDGIVRKYENDKYLVFIENIHYKDMESKKFDILDEMRQLDIGNTIPVTLSMGVSSTGKNPMDSYEKARAAVDVALGRGGDQAVVQEGSRLRFYGGKTKAVEKRNKVKSRVIAYALRQLIDQSEEVFVMGHKNPDMDSFGAGIGILNAVRDRGKRGYMIFNSDNPSIKNVYERMKEEEPDLLKSFLTTEEALDIINKDSLMVVVDNHKPSFTEAPVLLDHVENVVLIDHHRRGEEFLDNPVLVYLEPYASSTCELVTEILSYMTDKINLSEFEADALLAGITVDTKNFSFQTGVRTFEAASILKRAGADTTNVRQLFRDDFHTFVYKAEVVQSAKIISDIIAIGRLERDMENSLLVAAQSADELLSINEIEASFVLTLIEDRIHISGRSLGNISVQIILERLGGGGHLTSAGAQVEGKTIEEVEEDLIDEINKYLQESED